MDLIAGVDLSTYQIDIALISLEPIYEMSFEPVYRQAILGVPSKKVKGERVPGTELMQRIWNIRDAVLELFADLEGHPVRSVMIEKPMGHQVVAIGPLYAVAGALSVCLEHQPAWVEPNQWRKDIGCEKSHRKEFGKARLIEMCAARGWPEPADEHQFDALGVALSSRSAVYA